MRTSLYDWHLNHGAQMVDFHGWQMPLQYSGIIEEHRSVRQAAGLFDISHMGEIRLKGPDATRFVQWVVPRELEDMKEFEARYTPLCRENGGILDDIIIFRLSPDEYFLVVNAANTAKNHQWLAQQANGKFNVLVRDESESWALIAVQGPEAQNILGNAHLDRFPEKPFHATFSYLNQYNCFISRTGYTGEDGFEIYCRPEDAVSLWEHLMEKGEPYGMKPAGLGARDTLRLEAAFPLYGNELNEQRTPLETRLARFVNFEKDEFVGRQALLHQKEDGIQKRIIGLKMIEQGIPRKGYPVIHLGEVVGEITSGTFAPWLKQPIALAWVDAKFTQPGTLLGVQIRKKVVHAEICKLPFYSRGGSS